MIPARKRWKFLGRRHPEHYALDRSRAKELRGCRRHDRPRRPGRHPDGVDTSSIAIAEGKIGALGAEALLRGAIGSSDAAGKIVLPGAIDCHVHLGAEYDDWRGGPLAAATPDSHADPVRALRR